MKLTNATAIPSREDNYRIPYAFRESYFKKYGLTIKNHADIDYYSCLKRFHNGDQYMLNIKNKPVTKGYLHSQKGYFNLFDGLFEGGRLRILTSKRVFAFDDEFNKDIDIIALSQIKCAALCGYVNNRAGSMLYSLYNISKYIDISMLFQKIDYRYQKKCLKISPILSFFQISNPSTLQLVLTSNYHTQFIERELKQVSLES